MYSCFFYLVTMNKIKTNEIFKSANFSNFARFKKIEEIMTYTREDALKLNDEKTKIEMEISECKSVLDSEADVGMNGSLIDSEGYPRNDIDIVKVRTARQKIICLMNDHKEIMKKISDALESIHQQNSNGTVIENTNEESLEQLNIEDPTAPKAFAKIDLVSEGSPADDAGLKVGDLVIEFGTQNATNFKSLAEIGQLVKNSENRNIRVRIQRNLPFGELVTTLTLVPKQWSGQGLLGCKLIPL